MTFRTAPVRQVLIRTVFVVAIVGALAACGSAVATAPSGSPGTAQPAAAGGSTSVAPPPVAAEVRATTIGIDDPKLGPLTFDALVAGDPAAARTGKLVLFLHGFPETAEAYRQILPAVADAGYYAVAYSQRGYSPGARPAAVESYNILESVGDVGRVADSFGAETFHVVGHDWGGGVAWAVATALHDRVTTLTALSTPHPDVLSAGIGDPMHPQSKASAYMRAFREPGSEDRMLADGAAGFIAMFGPAAGGIPADHVAKYAEVLATPDALRAALNWYRANPLPLAVTLGPTTVPTLYIWGTDDGAFVRESAEATAAHVTAPFRYIELAGHGHWLPEDAAADIVPPLLAHLRPA